MTLRRWPDCQLPSVRQNVPDPTWPTVLVPARQNPQSVRRKPSFNRRNLSTDRILFVLGVKRLDEGGGGGGFAAADFLAYRAGYGAVPPPTPMPLTERDRAAKEPEADQTAADFALLADGTPVARCSVRSARPSRSSSPAMRTWGRTLRVTARGRRLVDITIRHGFRWLGPRLEGESHVQSVSSGDAACRRGARRFGRPVKHGSASLGGR